MFGPTDLNLVVKRILRHVETTYGPPLSSTSDNRGAFQMLPFQIDEIEAGIVSFEAKQATLIKKIVAAFIRECLHMPTELAYGQVE